MCFVGFMQIRLKTLSSADIEGSSDTMTIPNLPPPPRSSSPIYPDTAEADSYLQSNSADMSHYIVLSSEVRSILLVLSRLSRTLCRAISCGGTLVDPRSLDEEIINIHHEILGYLAPISTSNRWPSSINSSTLINDLNEATAIAALLYAKSLSRGTGGIPTHPRPIIRRLVSLLSRIHKYKLPKTLEISNLQSPYSHPTLFPPQLLLWLHYMGGIAAHGSEAEFFADGLIRLFCQNGSSGVDLRSSSIMPSWQDTKIMLDELLWFPMFYDRLGERLWKLAVTRSKDHCYIGCDGLITQVD